jgi:hypothetical protein
MLWPTSCLGIVGNYLGPFLGQHFTGIQLHWNRRPVFFAVDVIALAATSVQSILISINSIIRIIEASYRLLAQGSYSVTIALTWYVFAVGALKDLDFAFDLI